MRMTPSICLAVSFAAAAAADTAEPITPENVHRLEVAWIYDTGDSTEPVRPGGTRPAFEATPVFAAGRLYLSTPYGTVAALDASTGGEIWRVDLRIRRDADYGDFANRGPAVHRERVYVATVDGRLVCLAQRDGHRCDGFGRNGEIDLTEGLRRPPAWPGEYGVTSPPAVYRDLVIVGSAVADNSRIGMASGEVRAFDATTGALRWTFHPLPPEAAAGGANAWSRIVVDEANGLAFVPTGSASPDYFGGLRIGEDGYASSLVALDAATGEVVWHFQTVHHDLWDYDVASPALLFPGTSGPAVAAGSKSGHVFLFDRLRGEPLLPVVERSVPASNVPSEEAATTQPFPVKPESLSRQQVSESDLWGPTPEDLAACRRTLHELRNEGVFTPPDAKGSLHVPGNIGGLHWGGMAWDPTHRLLIAPVNHWPAVIRLIPASEFEQARRAFPERETTEQAGAPYAMSREFFVSPSGAPCVKPPWGELVAVDPDTGDVVWRVPLGDLSEWWPAAPGRPTGSPNLGGPATTDTGVVFIGATVDGYLRAFATRDGRELWKARLPASARATPLIFTTDDDADGEARQMVAIAAGGHDLPGRPIDTKLVVFSLGPTPADADGAR